MSILALIKLITASTWKLVSIFTPLTAIVIVLILSTMIMLKQVFNISTKKLVHKFLGGDM